MGSNMAVKIRIHHTHVDFSTPSLQKPLGDVSDEHCEWFHQDTSTTGKWDTMTLTGYCWHLTRKAPQTYKWNSKEKML
jgi:hypothetical protein